MDDRSTAAAADEQTPTDSDWARGILFVAAIVIGLTVLGLVILQLAMCGCTTRPA